MNKNIFNNTNSTINTSSINNSIGVNKIDNQAYYQTNVYD